jgi:hypothetical protein
MQSSRRVAAGDANFLRWASLPAALFIDITDWDAAVFEPTILIVLNP